MYSLTCRSFAYLSGTVSNDIALKLSLLIPTNAVKSLNLDSTLK